jgi:DNA-binding response OmpR family regulator
MMPGKDGFEVCRELRETSDFRDVPIFILTALVESWFEKEAFSCGADDFVHKMLGLRSLTKRIELVLRKKLIIQKRINHIEIGKWKINRETLSVNYNGMSSQLTPEEFEVLYFFAQNASRSLVPDHIDQIISGANLFQLSISLDKCLQGLTSKLGHRWLIYRGKSGFQFNAG